jgi:hypothetical protein
MRNGFTPGDLRQMVYETVVTVRGDLALIVMAGTVHHEQVEISPPNALALTTGLLGQHPIRSCRRLSDGLGTTALAFKLGEHHGRVVEGQSAEPSSDPDGAVEEAAGR